MTKGIYCYNDLKNDEEIVYVGRDSRINYDIRHKQHLEPSRYNAQPFNRVLQNNPSRYEYNKMIESDNLTNKELNDLENYYITEFDPKFNYTTGGNCDYTFSDETKLKMSINNGRYWQGKKRPKKFREQLSEMRKGNKNPSWKDYPRIIKKGFHKGQQKYALVYDGMIHFQTTDYEKISKRYEELICKIGGN